MSGRAYENPYPDYDEKVEILNAETGKLNSELSTKIQEKVDGLVRKLKAEQQANTGNEVDISMYTGASGIAFAYLRYLEFKGRERSKEHLEELVSYVLPLLQHTRRSRFAFLTGGPGPWSFLALLYNRMEMTVDSDYMARCVDNMYSEVIGVTKSSDELLYGKAGYLYSLLYLNKHVGKNDFRENAIRQVISRLLELGRRGAKKFSNTHNAPLYYEWRDKPYVGAAHGIIGILYVLLKAQEYLTKEELDDQIRPAVDFVLSLQFPTGNFPSNILKEEDRLIHWCHGAPGAVYLMVLAYQVYGDDKYLESARKCCEVIWQRGLLVKGFCLCHGVAGNGYPFLHMFQATKDHKYLYRAITFANWIFESGKEDGPHDRPLSLYEGLSGIIHYLLDLMDPLNAKFPAFEI